MKSLKNYLLNKTLITWIALCCVALMTTSCLNQKSDSGQVEEKIIATDNASLNPTTQSWAGLDAMCSNPGLSEAEAVVCKLDELLDEVAKSGKPLSDYEREVIDWIQSALEVRNQVCKNEKEITALAVGTMRVLAARGLINLPFAAVSVTASPSYNILVRKIIYAVVVEAVQNGCLINRDELQSVIGFGSSGAGSVNPVKGGSGSGTTVGGGGTTVGPTPAPGTSATCYKVEMKHKYACEPYCQVTNSCDLNACDSIKVMCKQYSCACN